MFPNVQLYILFDECGKCHVILRSIGLVSCDTNLCYSVFNGHCSRSCDLFCSIITVISALCIFTWSPAIFCLHSKTPGYSNMHEFSCY